MAAQPNLECFYDCSSPWTYFAFTRLIPLAERLDVAIRWRPILVGGVFNAVNKEVYADREKMFNAENSRRLNYYLKDLQDWARLCNLTVAMPSGHPINAVKAMRGAFYAQEQDRLVAYSRDVFETYWNSDTPDIANDGVLRAICDRVGLNSESFFRAINDQEYKDRLRTNTDELIQRGGYGSPTLFINGDDMYFGNDRLPLVEHRLSQLL
ncbi:MAG: 2-hydroxychromene-2-carboxylate isomerase [Halieaceae bacterium]|nr:2-hydroxychromene-2-carboxylate isomerase [Halieaceae bacterium]MCP4465692.1 2-hydroxychromene-2-carboxylate isomerase [Halieaceae bacterium]MCP4842909.1 2-hydroxychromene-2-carboxylate isomerase [Halieaceae bacterium]